MFFKHKVAITSMIHGSLSPQHGAASGCRWRKNLQIWRLAANILKKTDTGSRRGVVL
jgi:hypothetical protein